MTRLVPPVLVLRLHMQRRKRSIHVQHSTSLAISNLSFIARSNLSPSPKIRAPPFFVCCSDFCDF